MHIYIVQTIIYNISIAHITVETKQAFLFIGYYHLGTCCISRQISILKKMYFGIFQLKIKIKLIFEKNGPAADANHNIYLESPYAAHPSIFNSFVVIANKQ